MLRNFVSNHTSRCCYHQIDMYMKMNAHTSRRREYHGDRGKYSLGIGACAQNVSFMSQKLLRMHVRRGVSRTFFPSCRRTYFVEGTPGDKEAYVLADSSESEDEIHHYGEDAWDVGELQGDSPDEPAMTAAITEAKKKHRIKENSNLILAVAAVVVLGVTNRVLYKMALAPMGSYTFFLAQFQTFGYLAFYSSCLWFRTMSGDVDSEMLEIPKRYYRRFIAIGFVEATSSLLSFIGAAKLPGVMLPLLGQSIIFWQVLLAIFILGKKLGVSQLGGVGLVVSGVIMAAWPSGHSVAASTSNAMAHTAVSAFPGVDLHYASLFVFATLFPAIDTIIKERVFKDSKKQLGKDLDLFIVNTFGSLSQCLFVFLLLPALTMAQGLPLSQLPDYLISGWQCFQGITPSCGADCSGAPLLPVM